MPYIIIIDKSGNVKEMNIKEYKESDLFKKANFKSPEGFLCQTKWNVVLDKKKYQVAVYGKTNGKAGQENKYEFPPPIDSVLFFGGCVLTNITETGSILDLRLSEWNAIYENLMDGFEDLDEGNDDETEEETEDGEILKIGKDGYVCDDFVVEDEEVDYDNLSMEDDEDDADDESEEEKPVLKKKAKRVVKVSSKKKTTESKPEVVSSINSYLDYQSELSEEEYL